MCLQIFSRQSYLLITNILEVVRFVIDPTTRSYDRSASTNPKRFSTDLSHLEANGSRISALAIHELHRRARENFIDTFQTRLRTALLCSDIRCWAI